MSLICIDNKYTNLTVGKAYKVDKVDGDWVIVVNDIGYQKEYHRSMFAA